MYSEYVDKLFKCVGYERYSSECTVRDNPSQTIEYTSSLDSINGPIKELHQVSSAIPTCIII